MQPNHLWPDSPSFTLIMAPVEVVKNGGGWACVVINTVFSAFSFRPASPKNSTSLSNVMISKYLSHVQLSLVSWLSDWRLKICNPFCSTQFANWTPRAFRAPKPQQPRESNGYLKGWQCSLLINCQCCSKHLRDHNLTPACSAHSQTRAFHSWRMWCHGADQSKPPGEPTMARTSLRNLAIMFAGL